MSTVTGIIEKAIQNKAGYYAVLVNDVWYSTYKDDYSGLEGKLVEFDTVKKGNFFNMKGKPTVKAQPAGAPAQAAAPTVTPDNRQASIVLQSSYKTAAEITTALLANGLVQLPSKKADQFDAVLGYVDEIARRLFDNCINPSSFLSVEDEEEQADDPAPKGWNAAEA